MMNKIGGLYSPIKGKSFKDLENELQSIYDSKYKDSQHTFDSMVELFSRDDFYNGHYVAKQYLWFKSQGEE